jgi:hypothetical protein
MNAKSAGQHGTTRRNAVAAGAGLVLIAGSGLTSRIVAHEGTPHAAGGRDLNGYFGVTRQYVLTEGAEVQAVVDASQSFADAISGFEGFAAYIGLYDAESRTWISVSIFEDPEDPAESTALAADYVADFDISELFEDPEPPGLEGTVVVNAGF